VLRFHLDENVDPALAKALIRRGIDATLPGEVGLIGATDEEHLAFALREHRVIVTHDADFLRLASNNAQHAGIAFCHFGYRSIGQMMRELLLLSEFYGADDLRGKIEYL
jgi:predicted nuclease of predicted toxin-antitoxin system